MTAEASPLADDSRDERIEELERTLHNVERELSEAEKALDDATDELESERREAHVLEEEGERKGTQHALDLLADVERGVRTFDEVKAELEGEL